MDALLFVATLVFFNTIHSDERSGVRGPRMWVARNAGREVIGFESPVVPLMRQTTFMSVVVD